MTTHADPDVTSLYPLSPHLLDKVLADLPEGVCSPAFYGAVIESQCGRTDDSQPVEQYDGSLGVTRNFVADHQASVGQLQWDADLGSAYADPGNVADVRWCTGTLISHNLFLTAGHCFDQNPFGWRVPRIDGTDDPIPPDEIASRMHVNFNYQVDPDGTLRTEAEFDIEALVEYRLGGLDFAIVRLAGTPGASFGIGRIATSDADVDDMLAIIGHPAGVPKRVEAGRVTEFDGDRIRYNDIDTLGGNSGSAIWHSPSGEIVGVHTNGGCTTSGTGSNFGVRISRIREESPTVRALGRGPLPVTAGVKTVRQQSSGRFMDAHEHSGADFSVVTRTAQNNDTQRWVAMHVPGELSTYTLQQLSSARFVDAHEHSGADFSVVTRPDQDNDTQRWVLAPLGDGSYTAMQSSSGRFMDAHQSSGNDFSVVTRTAQNNDTQKWRFTPVGAVYTIQQVSSGRHVDAHEHSGADFSVVTRPVQDNDTQRWVVSYLGGDSFTVQQLSSGRFVDAHEHSGADFSVVTRPALNNDTQRWVID